VAKTWRVMGFACETEPTVYENVPLFASVKLKVAGIVPREQTWEDLGYSSAQQGRMRAMFADERTQALGPEFSALMGTDQQPPTGAPAPAPALVPAGV